MGLNLSTTEAEQVLATLHRITPQGRKAFRARLRALQRYDVPHGIKPGKGHAARYTFDGLMQTALVVELLRAGVAPRWAIAAVFSSWSELRSSLMSGTVPAGDPPSRKVAQDWVWAVPVDAFRDLNDAPEDAAVGGWLLSSRDLRRLFSDPSVDSRITVIRGSRVFQSVSEIITDTFGFVTRKQLKAEAEARFGFAPTP